MPDRSADAAAPTTPAGGGGPASLATAALQELQERLARITADRNATPSDPPVDARTFAERMAAWEAADNGPITCFDCAACTRDEDRPLTCNDPYGYCHPGPCEPRTDEWGQPVA